MHKPQSAAMADRGASPFTEHSLGRTRVVNPARKRIP